MKHILCDSTGKGFLEAYAWFPLDFTSCIFPPLLVWFCFAVINYSHKYDCILSPMSPTESLNLRIVLGVLNPEGNHRSKQTFCSYFFLYGICQFLTQVWVEGPGRVIAKVPKQTNNGNHTGLETQKV